MMLSDETFIARFEDCTLPEAAFDHRGHLRLAWLYLRRDGLDDALPRICGGIDAYATSLGATAKFHRTLTEALVRIIFDRMQSAGEESFDRFLARNPDLVSDTRGLLARHYTEDRLHAPAARRAFVEPDLQPLPDAD